MLSFCWVCVHAYSSTGDKCWVMCFWVKKGCYWYLICWWDLHTPQEIKLMMYINSRTPVVDMYEKMVIEARPAWNRGHYTTDIFCPKKKTSTFLMCCANFEIFQAHGDWKIKGGYCWNTKAQRVWIYVKRKSGNKWCFIFSSETTIDPSSHPYGWWY